MTTPEIAFLVFAILGGLGLFIFGMNVMTDGLSKAAGSSLRTFLSCATRNRFAGLTMGTLLGALVQSSATTVMLVGFINAGLMTLAESVPPMLGANFGTTLSMQMISFKLGDYCFLAIALGLVLQMVAPHPKAKNLGYALLGFGLIFLGMNTMSGAIKPHRELFAGILSGIHGNTYLDVMKGLALSAAITGIIQSSGAVIAMCFALITAGVFTDISQVFPIVLGAHIGTCATALLGSIGTNIDARRSAVSHLMFNILTSLTCAALAPVFLKYLPMTSGDLVRQTANAHTSIMVFGILFILPISPLYARFISLLVPSKYPPPQPSFLDNKLVEFPEKALYAAILELQRVSRISAQSLRLTLEVIFTKSKKDVQTIKLNENVIDEIKKAMKSYIAVLTTKTLSRRQAILVQNINRCMADIERIGDHVDELCDITTRRHKHPKGRFSREILDHLVILYEGAAKVLHQVIESLNPENTDFQLMAQNVLRARDEYVEKSINAKAVFTEKVANHEIPPLIGVFFSEYQAALDRIVKHAKMIALAEKQPYFWIKRKKLQEMGQEAPEVPLPERVNAKDYLDQLHRENYM
ncbi:MAG: Na/Pi cotransporter family protein [Lentisphaerota bacterium]